MHLHQLSGQRQADAQTALAPISITRLPEHVEDGPQRLAVEADPIVDHAYGDARLVGGRLESYASALRRVLGAVVEQVGDRLRDPCGINVKPDRISGTSISRLCRAAEMAGDAASTAVLTIEPSVKRSRRSSILPS